MGPIMDHMCSTQGCRKGPWTVGAERVQKRSFLTPAKKEEEERRKKRKKGRNEDFLMGA